jgi:hypothetical protein
VPGASRTRWCERDGYERSLERRQEKGIRQSRAIAEAFIYELLDEPELLPVKPVQAEMRILNANGEPTAASIAAKKFLLSYC